MVYRTIGVMSGSSLDGLDIAFVEFQQQAGGWGFSIRDTACIPYDENWKRRLENAASLSAQEYLLLHSSYGSFIGERLNEFIESRKLSFQVALISSHGHTVFHLPSKKMTSQLGEGASIAARTGLPVVTDLRAMDIALGGQGAPIVPIGEKLLLGEYDYFLNIGGIANISANRDPYIAFDVCPANRVLNLLAAGAGKAFDEGGKLAAAGNTETRLLAELNALDYYRQSYPKSLANDFGTDHIYPLIKATGLSVTDALRTYVEHIVEQTVNAVRMIHGSEGGSSAGKLLVTGGGAFNSFLVRQLGSALSSLHIETIVPGPELVNYKEAMIMAFIGVLRWRQEYNVLSSVTGASRNSIGGSIWTGAEA